MTRTRELKCTTTNVTYEKSRHLELQTGSRGIRNYYHKYAISWSISNQITDLLPHWLRVLVLGLVLQALMSICKQDFAFIFYFLINSK